MFRPKLNLCQYTLAVAETVFYVSFGAVTETEFRSVSSSHNADNVTMAKAQSSQQSNTTAAKQCPVVP